MILVVPRGHCVLLERFGRHVAICRQGLHLHLPIVTKVKRLDEWRENAVKRRYLIELTEQQTDTPPRTCHTRDNVSVETNAVVYWRIVDPVKAVYEVDVLPHAISDLALNCLRANIGTLELDQVLSERQQLNERIAGQLAETAAAWGVRIGRVEIQELKTDQATSEAMLQQMDAERRRRATVAEAEGRAHAEVTVAEAERKASVLRAQGIAESLERLGQAEGRYLGELCRFLSPERAAAVLLAQKALDAQDKITRNPAHKVFLPGGQPLVLRVDDDSIQS